MSNKLKKWMKQWILRDKKKQDHQTMLMNRKINLNNYIRNLIWLIKRYLSIRNRCITMLAKQTKMKIYSKIQKNSLRAQRNWMRRSRRLI